MLLQMPHHACAGGLDALDRVLRGSPARSSLVATLAVHHVMNKYSWTLRLQIRVQSDVLKRRPTSRSCSLFPTSTIISKVSRVDDMLCCSSLPHAVRLSVCWASSPISGHEDRPAGAAWEMETRCFGHPTATERYTRMARTECPSRQCQFASCQVQLEHQGSDMLAPPLTCDCSVLGFNIQLS